MSLDPRLPNGFEQLESSAASAWQTAKANPGSIKAAAEEAVRRWVYATGEYYSPHPLGCEFVAKRGPGELSGEDSAPYCFGFDAEERLRVQIERGLAVRSACTSYDDGLQVTTFFEEDEHRTRARATGIMVCWRDPHEPTILVIRRGDALYREVIDVGEKVRAHVRAASSSWRNFGHQVRYDVEVDETGRTRRVATAEGAVLYERPRRTLAQLLRELSRDLPSEIARVLVQSDRPRTNGHIVVSYGDGPERFPPMLHIVTAPRERAVELIEALEHPSTYEVPLYSDASPPWVRDLSFWLSEGSAQDAVLATYRKVVEKLNRTAKKGDARVELLSRQRG